MRGEQVIQLALLPPEAQVGGSARSRGLLDRHAQQVRARARLPEPPTPSQLTTPAHAASAGPHRFHLENLDTSSLESVETAADALDGLDCDRLQPRGQARTCASPDAAPPASLCLVWSLWTHLRQLQPAGVGSVHTNSPLPPAAVVAQAARALGATATARSSSRDRN